jgi:hypothetical protein
MKTTTGECDARFSTSKAASATPFGAAATAVLGVRRATCARSRSLTVMTESTRRREAGPSTLRRRDASHRAAARRARESALPA